MFSSLKHSIKRDLYIDRYRQKIADSYQRLPNKVPLTKAQESEIKNYWKGLLASLFLCPNRVVLSQICANGNI